MADHEHHGGAAWESVGGVSPNALVETRLVLHWAAQIVSAAGATLLPAKEDASHTSFTWDHEWRALMSHPLPKGERVGLVMPMQLTASVAPTAPRIIVIRADGEMTSNDIEGRTIDELLGWLAQTLGGTKLTRPAHELPAHAVGTGAPFPKVNSRAVDEVARWFGNADLVITSVAGTNANASAVRCWPHHFDIATLITIRPGTTIGVGLSPGDGTYQEPYFYVTPWPYPARGTTLPALRSGQWHLEGWTGAVLRGESIVRASIEADAQRSIADTFLNDSVAGCEALLGSA